MVRVIMIVEMAGRPAVHLTKTLEEHMRVLNKIKNMKVHSIRVSEPKEIPSQNGKPVAKEDIIFTAFAEADFEVENFSQLNQTMFDFMPSSIEVIDPSKITFDSTEATDLLNNISGRLHRYDEVAKIAGAKLQHMNSQLEIAKKIIAAKDEEIKKLSSKKPAKKTTKKKTTNKKKTTVKKTTNKKK